MLTEKWGKAQRAIKGGYYGVKKSEEAQKEETITTKKRKYVIETKFSEGDLSQIHKGYFVDKNEEKNLVIVKISAAVESNIFLQNEVKILRILEKKTIGKSAIFSRYLPRLYETFSIREEGRQHFASCFKQQDEYFTLRDVMNQYPDGVHPKTMAWIWNRLMEILGFIHLQGIIHGAVIPEHILIHPVQHGIKLIDWTGATTEKRVRLMSVDLEEFYAPEIFSKKDVGSFTDIFMAAQCMKAILAGGLTNFHSKKIQNEIKELLEKCTRKEVEKRPNNAWKIRDESKNIFQTIFGNPGYHELKMTKS